MPPARRRTATANDVRDQPAYLVAEAARYLRLPAATLRSWVLGRDYSTAKGRKRFPVIVTPASRDPTLLSFWNLIEAHVLRALRTEHGVSVAAVREALAYAEATLGVERLLLSSDLSATAGRLFLDRYGELIELSASGQMAIRQVLEAHLRRVEWDQWKFPVRLYPFVSAEMASGDRRIAIDPAVAFGRPFIASRGVTTAVIAERIDSGETLETIAADYDLEPKEIEQAIVYERAA